MIFKYPKKATEHYEYPQISILDDIGSADPHTALDDCRKDAVIYIHIPFCRNNCRFCNYYRLHRFDTSVTDAYFGSLQRELLGYLPYVRHVKGVQFGGGTPTCVPLGYYQRLLGFVKSTFDCDDPLRVSMESDIKQLLVPDTLTRLEQCGIDRISFGVQSFSGNTRLALGLPYSGEELAEKIGVICSSTQLDCNADLMFNLPEQEPEELLHDIDLCFSLGINCVDLYHLNIFPGTRMYKWMQKRQLLKSYYSQSREKSFYQAYQILTTDPSIHFCTSNTVSRREKGPNLYINMQLGGKDCWQLGIGASSRGFVGNAGYRNHSDIDTYIRSVADFEHGIRSLRKCPDPLRRRLVLMPNLLKMDLSGCDFSDSLSEKMEQLTSSGVLSLRGSELSLNPDYYFYAGNVSEEFYSAEDVAYAYSVVMNNYRNGLNMYNQDKVNMG